MENARDFEVVTFDCYGTLIDWETGIKAAFKEYFEGLGISQVQESKLLDIYHEEEKRIEAQKPYKPYRTVLSEASLATTRRLGKGPETLSVFLAEKLPRWYPFPDTNPALERLARKYKLGILSNVDNDLLSGTLRHFAVSFDIVVTAEQVRSYKPGFRHFEQARNLIGERTWLHVAASLYHDIEPASKLGIETVWVNRENHDEGRKHRKRIVKEVENLTQLANWLAP